MRQTVTTKRTITRLFFLAIVITLSMAAFTVKGYAETKAGNAVASWNIGGDGKAVYNEATVKDNVVATFYEDGELLIAGTGDTAVFNLNVNAPWYKEYRSAVKKITFEAGVKPTSLSFFANGCSSLTAAPEIPDSVTSLDNTFRNCVSLTTAPEVPSGVTNMRGTFNTCKELTAPPQIPDGVKNMDSTFYGCSKLADAPAIPGSVTYLRGLFAGCRALTVAPEMPAGITSMQTVFSGCVNLKTAPEIPDSVTEMQSAFRDCAALKGEMKVNATNISSYGDCFLNASTDGGQLVLRYNTDSENTVDKLLTTKSANSDIVKDAVEPVASWYIGGNGVTLYKAARAKDNVKAALYDDGELKVSGKGNTAVFKDTSDKLSLPPWHEKYSGDIKKITFMQGVEPTNLDCFAFNCASLTEVANIPDSVITMNFTFYKCGALAIAPRIPDNVAEINGTFQYCKALVVASEIPDGVTTMNGTFYRCGALTTAPDMPNGVEDMSGTFSSCSRLKTVPKLPSSVTDMSYTFSECYALITAPEIPEGVVNMSNTFYHCLKLITAPPDIPRSVTDMSNTFDSCQRLNGEITVYATNIVSYPNCFYNTTIDKNSKLVLNYGPGAGGSVNKLMSSIKSGFVVKGVEKPAI